MKRIWLILIIIAAVCAALWILTYFNPTIRSAALALSQSSHLPIWLAGLLAPFLVLFKKFWPESSSANGELEQIRQENERLKEEQNVLRRSVESLVAWRNQELETRRAEISRLQSEVSTIRASIESNQSTLERLEKQGVNGTYEQMSDAQKITSANEHLNDLGIRIYE